MKIAIMQPYFFPYIGYMQLVHASDLFIFYDDVNYIKRGWINRNRIMINGDYKYINVQLSKASQNKKINDTFLNWDGGVKMMKTLKMSYAKAPFYEEGIKLFSNIINKAHNNIADLNIECIMAISEYLGLNCKFMISSANFADTSHLKKEKRLIAMCKKLKASEYINPIGGTKIYSKEQFARQGITIRFLKTEETGLEDTSLSILHLIMHHSREDIVEALNKYSFI